MTSGAADLLEAFDLITLTELDDVASLQTRTDRKYVLDAGRLHDVIGVVADRARVLDIDGLRSFGYETVYFDTPGHDSYLATAHRRPGRFKVRTRTYVDAGRCGLEVKLRDRRGQTAKHRLGHDPDARERLGPASIAFVRSFPGLEHVAHRLAPVLTTRYGRSTLEVGQSRVTIDVDVACRTLDGRAVGLGDLVVVETKSAGAPTVVDRALWRLGARPVAMSKFGVGMAALHPVLPANRWHRVIERHLRPLGPPLRPARSAR